MPTFGRTDALNLTRFLALPGRKVHVSFPSGNDTTGDGSVSAPYKTMARGAQDLRSGRNDMLVIVDGGTSSETPVVISSKSDIAIVGLGGPAVRPPTGRAAVSVVSSWAASGSNGIATIPAGHGYVANDYVFIHNCSTSGGARLRGLAQVVSTTATTVTLASINVIAGQQPVTGGTQGFLTPCPLTLADCQNVIVSGLFFSTPTLVDQWSGLGIALPIPPARNSRAILISDCYFQNASVGFLNYPTDVSPWGNGESVYLERNTFLWQTGGAFFTGNVRYAGLVYLHGGTTITFAENNFFRFDQFASPAVADGCIHIAGDPVFATVFTKNLFDGTLNGAGGNGIPLTSIVRLQTGLPAVSRYYFEDNYYTHPGVRPGQELIQISPAASVYERIATRFPGYDQIPTQLDRVRTGVGALATLRITGGSASAIQTNATQADGFFDRASVVVSSASGSAGAIVHAYAQANGTFTLESALPFTPAAGDTLMVIRLFDPHTLLDHDTAAYNVAGSVGEKLNRVDVAVSSRAAPGDAMDLVVDAVDAAAVAASGAAEIAAAVAPAPTAADVADAVWDEALAGHAGAGSAGEAAARVDVAVSTRAIPADVAAAQAAVQADIAGLNDLSAGDVQAALTAQGYTIARAVLLDNLDAAVSTRSSPGDAMDLVVDAVDAAAVAASGAAEIAAAVPAAPTAGAIADAVWDESLAAHVSLGSVGEALRLVRAASAGRVRLNVGNAAQWTLELFDEDEATVLRTFNLKDQTGAAISAANNPLVTPAGVIFADRDVTP